MMLRLLAICLISLSMVAPAWSQEIPVTAQHKKLAELAGKWDFTMKSDAGESKGASEYKLECNGLWLTSDFSTDMGGMKFQGKGIDGYDTTKKKFISIWVDSFTTAPMFFEGDFDAKTNTLELKSSSPVPGSNTPAVWRSVTKIVDKDNHTFEMYLKPQGEEEKKMMTVEYTRAKK